MKIRVRCIDPHMPHGEIQEVEEDKAREMVESGQWLWDGEEYPYVPKKEVIVEKEIIVEDKTKLDMPDESWKEKDIKKWMKKNNIPIQYYISCDTKKEVLGKIKRHLENK